MARTKKKELYVASYLGFSEAGRHFMYDKLIPAIQEEGFGVIDPWKLTNQDYVNFVLSIPDTFPGKRDALREMDDNIGRNNEKAIDRAHGIVAVLDGAEIDSGVVSEVMYGGSKGKRTLGYRSDFRLASENLGVPINLQFHYFLKKYKGMIVPSLEELRRNLRPMFGNPIKSRSNQ